MSADKTDPASSGTVPDEVPDVAIDDEIVENPEDVEQAAEENAAPGEVPAPMPTKKDVSLREFLSKMDDYAPIIPDAVTNYYLTTAGLPPPPQTSIQLSRLIALATQKFVADIAGDAYQYSRIRHSTTSANNPHAGVGMMGAAGGASSSKEAGLSASKAAGLGIQRPGFGGGGPSATGHNKIVLTMEDLGMAVAEYGVNLKRAEFYR